MFENNGVLKRENINNIVKQIDKKERQTLKKFGIKIGRYHVYQPRMVKPAAISFKTILWNCFYSLSNNDSPTFGLNFVKNFSNNNKDYLLICGFETFNEFFVRIDILERLFVQIIKLATSISLNLLVSWKIDLFVYTTF